ncbi:hypothetical protein M0R45_038104 [Rubus argutus]|uniref:Secreted protein n=1 Tax=Rubus argutus TaxID=59490 RepID=A0AAW1W648_RUBAR
MPALKASTASWTSITVVWMPRPCLAENGCEAEWSKVGMEAVELGRAGSTSVGEGVTASSLAQTNARASYSPAQPREKEFA